MWQRSELKMRAKQVLSGCFLTAVVVCLISGLLAGEFSRRGSASGGNNSERAYTDQEVTSDLFGGKVDGDRMAARVGTEAVGFLTKGLLPLVIYFGILVFVIGALISIVIGYPILVGSKRFFMSSRQQQTGIGEVLYGFRSGHAVNIIFVQFLQNLKIFLWTLLLIIPGIIKSYEYRMIPYILSENPGIEQRRAFDLSIAMMEGQKLEVFLLDISFFFWDLLGAFTCGLANIFYINPYKAATNAELYAVLREDILRRGIVNAYELPGFAGTGPV